jgi:hypothetical protein
MRPTDTDWPRHLGRQVFCLSCLAAPAPPTVYKRESLLFNFHLDQPKMSSQLSRFDLPGFTLPLDYTVSLLERHYHYTMG